MAVEQDANVFVRIFLVTVAAFRKVAENLDTFIDSSNDLPGCFLIVPPDVIVYLSLTISRSRPINRKVSK